MNKFTLLLLTAIFPLHLFAQHLPKKWTIKNPFEQNTFIENKGQYVAQEKPELKNILFGAKRGGVQYYFAGNAIGIMYYKTVKRTGQEIEHLEEQTHGEGKPEEDDKELQYKLVPEYHVMLFNGANADVSVMGQNTATGYYCFGSTKDNAVKANAFKRVIYYNLYPGIDMTVFFPDGKPGFEYSFTVHPGADISQIKIQYPLNGGLQFDDNSNLKIQSSFGEITDQPPKASQQDKTVDCSFSLNNSVVQFKVGNYDKTQDLLIDPWTVTPTFAGLNDAYDVDYDNSGNCYIYGGTAPWQVIKYDSTGKFIWSYTTTFVDVPNGINFGDFAVDKKSQSVYIVEDFGFTTGAQVEKLNMAGAAVNSFGGNVIMNEMWRIAFSPNTENAVIAGGGTSSHYQAAVLDTTLSNIVPINVLNVNRGYYDFWGLTTDYNGNCYMATCRSSASPPNIADNIIVKAPTSTITPVTWEISNHYDIEEAGSVMFAYGTYDIASPTNAFNGMAVGSCTVYSYDSYTLKQWSQDNGTLLDSLMVNKPDTNSYGIELNWGGLASDQCDNIFLGSKTTVKQYNIALSLVDTFNMPDTIYDVRVGPGNLLYTCGQGFVSVTRVPTLLCESGSIQYTNRVNYNCALQKAVAIVSPSGGAAVNAVWNTIPIQVGDTASNLSSGTYIVTLTNSPALCTTDTVYDTVQVTIPGHPDTVTVNSPATCNGASATLLATGASSYTWQPATGLNTTTGDSIIAKVSTTTTYTVIGDSGGCFDTAQAIVTINPAPPLIILPQPPPIICFSFESDTLRVASHGSDFTWSPSEGLSATTGFTVIANPSVSVTYTVTGIDSLGCLAMGTEPVTILQIANRPSFYQHGDTLISSAKYDNQWYRNDTLLLGDTSQYLIITVLGSYYDEINNEANGCSTSSDTVAITTLTGINQLTTESRQLTVYPNPFSNQLTVISKQLPIDEVDITDELGQVLYSTPLNPGAVAPQAPRGTFEIDLSSLPNGMYFITVINTTGRVVVPVVK